MVATEQRQEHLKIGKYFTCHCARCEDPTELGTHFRTFKCNKCDAGLILSQDPYGKTNISTNHLTVFLQCIECNVLQI